MERAEARARASTGLEVGGGGAAAAAGAGGEIGAGLQLDQMRLERDLVEKQLRHMEQVLRLY